MSSSPAGSDLGPLIPADLRELLRGQTLALRRPVWGQRHGHHASARTGIGLDFRDHRAYVPGDDPRLLDWRAVARRDRLVLRQTESEDELSLFLVVDASGAMGYGEGPARKTAVANALAGALSVLAIRQGDRVGLLVGRDGDLDATLLRPLSGRERLAAIAQVLHASESSGVCPWNHLLTTLAPRLPRRSLIVCLSDFLDPTAHERDPDVAEQNLHRGLAQLRARGHDVVLVQVLHRDELEFPWDGRRLLRVEDLRGTRPAIEGPGVRLRDRYLQRLTTHLEHTERVCEHDGVFLHRVVTDAAASESFVALLARLEGGATELPVDARS